MIERDWYGAYSDGWTGLICPAAFGHPAKFARGLIRRIYDHLFEQGYLHEGDTIIDPFAGVGLGALHAMQHGCHWIGMELEQSFVDLGQQNLDLWLATYAPHFPRWGTGVILQGDSRNLCEIVGRVAGGAAGSPPFSSDQPCASQTRAIKDYHAFTRGDGTKRDHGMRSPGNLDTLRATDADHAQAVQAAVGSPPYAESLSQGNDPEGYDYTRYGGGGQLATSQRYGQSDGQLGAMYEGDFQAAVSSAPYTASLASDDPDKRGGLYRDPKRRNDKTLTAEYGDSAGQLGAMREGDHGAEARACVASPPYEGSMDSPQKCGIDWGKAGRLDRCKPSPNRISPQVDGGMAYGGAQGQLGNTTGDTFWSAARVILEQTYRLLAPGAYSAWVCKSFVRKGERVDFPNQWRELGEACGFETVEWIRAWLVEDRGAQYTLDNGLDVRTVERKSFFRRLAERKGSPRIDYEVVIIQRKSG